MAEKRWLKETYSIGQRFKYFNTHMIVCSNIQSADGTQCITANYIDKRGVIQEINLSIDQLKAISKI